MRWLGFLRIQTAKFCTLWSLLRQHKPRPHRHIQSHDRLQGPVVSGLVFEQAVVAHHVHQLAGPLARLLARARAHQGTERAAPVEVVQHLVYGVQQRRFSQRRRPLLAGLIHVGGDLHGQRDAHRALPVLVAQAQIVPSDFVKIQHHHALVQGQQVLGVWQGQLALVQINSAQSGGFQRQPVGQDGVNGGERTHEQLLWGMKSKTIYIAHPSSEQGGHDSHALSPRAEKKMLGAFRSDEENYVQTLCKKVLKDGDYRTVSCEVADGHLWALGVKVLELETKISCRTCRGKLMPLLK